MFYATQRCRTEIGSATNQNIFKSPEGKSRAITIEQYNQELEEAERQIEAGNFTTHEDLKKERMTW